MGEAITLTICKPTMNNEIKNFRIGIFNSLHHALSNNNLQLPPQLQHRPPKNIEILEQDLNRGIYVVSMFGQFY